MDMEVDAAVLDHVIDGVTYGVLEPVNTPIGQRTASLMPPLVQHNNQWSHKDFKIHYHFHLHMKLVSYKHQIPNCKVALHHWLNNTTNGSWLVS
jgi:hypothetical protein